MKNLLFVVSALVLFTNVSMAAGDADAGKTKSAVCAACHGAEGAGKCGFDVDVWLCGLNRLPQSN